jgi:hypothetical protein
VTDPIDPFASGLFVDWIDPTSGVRSHLLDRRATAWQQAFYFTSPNLTHDGRWMWLYAADPPSPHVLSVVDLAQGTVTAFPETHFEAESPLVDLDTGEVMWAHPSGVFRRGPEPGDATTEIATIGGDVTGERDVRRLSTHLTRSAAGALVNLDVWAGNRWIVGVVELATGDFHPWFESERRHQHSQFHPHDPTLLMMAQDYWHDPDTGERQHWQNRIWLLDEATGARPVFPDDDDRVQVQFHEWWDPSGEGIWYVDVGWGTGYVDLASGERRTVWPSGTCHSHASVDGTLLVGDVNTYRWHDEPCRVAFFDASTGVELDIVSELPRPPARAAMGYHPDPHPQLVADDRYIAYTTTVRGQLDIALVAVDELLERTR